MRGFSALLAITATASLLLMPAGCGGGGGPPTPPANTAPTARFTVTPTFGTVETEFQFDASDSTDAQDATGALQVRWDWTNDGTYDTSLLAAKTATHTFASPGTKTIKLLVRDTGGLTDTTTRTVTVSGVTGDVGAIID